MDELISRQAAIDALRDYLVGKRCPDDGTLTCRLIENEVINKLPSALSTNLAEVGTDAVSREAVKELAYSQIRSMYCGVALKEQRETMLRIADNVIGLLAPVASKQPEIVRCKDCKHHWTHKCMDSMPIERCDLEQTFYDAEVDYCSLAERRTDG